MEQLLSFAGQAGSALRHDPSTLGQADLLAQVCFAALAKLALVALRNV